MLTKYSFGMMNVEIIMGRANRKKEKEKKKISFCVLLLFLSTYTNYKIQSTN